MNPFFFIALFCSITIVNAQSNKGKSNVNIVSVKTQSVFGVNVGYYVEFINNSSKKVDGIKWQALFMNNFGEKLGVRKGSWQSGNFISEIKPGAKTKDLENNYIEGATKVFITITSVHFVE